MKIEDLLKPNRDKMKIIISEQQAKRLVNQLIIECQNKLKRRTVKTK